MTDVRPPVFARAPIRKSLNLRNFTFRLYETQVKKIVKVQSMLRSFLARRNVEKKKTLSREHSLQTGNEDELPEE